MQAEHGQDGAHLLRATVRRNHDQIPAPYPLHHFFLSLLTDCVVRHIRMCDCWTTSIWFVSLTVFDVHDGMAQLLVGCTLLQVVCPSLAILGVRPVDGRGTTFSLLVGEWCVL